MRRSRRSSASTCATTARCRRRTGALRIDGLVRRPHELSLDDLRALPRRELTATLQCAGNRRADLLKWRDIPGEAPWGPGATGTARWAGAALADVLALAGRRPRRRVRRAHRRRPRRGGRPAAELRDLDPARQGDRARGPARLGDERRAARAGPRRAAARDRARVHRRAQRQVARADRAARRAVRRLLPGDRLPDAARRRRAGPRRGLPARRGRAQQRLPAAPAARTAAPSSRATRSRAGRGAWSASRCRSPAATGPSAELLEDQGEWAWRLWRATVELPPGRHELCVRAWDSAGATQPETPAAVWNPKGYANSAWGRIEVTIA